MAKSSSEHSGHRQRMKEKYLKYGLEIFEQHEILEIALFYAVPMKNTNPIAHKLIDKFGSYSAVFDAPITALREAGLTENAAVFLKLIPDLMRVYEDDKFSNSNKILNDANIPIKLKNKLTGKKREAVCLLLMDARYQELYCGIISNGSVANADVNIPKICELALTYSARYVVIAHNHPSGICIPSSADLLVTAKLNEALKCIKVALLDHYVVYDDDFVSLRDSNMLYKNEEEYRNTMQRNTQKKEIAGENNDNSEGNGCVADINE